jgi:hypothetical protein
MPALYSETRRWFLGKNLEIRAPTVQTGAGSWSDTGQGRRAVADVAGGFYVREAFDGRKLFEF